MAQSGARSAVKVNILKTQDDAVSWLFMFCSLLMAAGLVHMWSHWIEISASLGFYPAACVLAATTGTALIVSLWVNTGND
jgi:hypothetical protein